MKEPWEMTTEAKKRIEQVVRNVNRRKYSRLVQVDYANAGIDLFNENQFAMDLGISPCDLETIMDIRRYPCQFGDKGIMCKPTPEEIWATLPDLAAYLRRSRVKFCLYTKKPVPAEVQADYPDLREEVPA